MPEPLEEDWPADPADQPSPWFIAFMRVLAITCAVSILLVWIDGFVNGFDAGGPQALGWITFVGGLVLIFVSICSLSLWDNPGTVIVVSLVIGVVAFASCVLMPSLNH